MKDATGPAADLRTVVGADQGTRTRGFLFADLRDYTRYVESAGAPAGAALLERYRVLVRDAVTRHRGAEIRTEGDSFYVVLPSASAAVECGLAIVEAARRSTETSWTDPIRVGVGIHAGEAVQTSEGPVGSAVNIAARVCARAAAGEVLVTDTVRSLTRSMLPVRYSSRGRRRLKGVEDSMELFAVVPVGEPIRAAQSRRLRLAAAAVVLVGLILAAAILVWLLRPPGTG